MTRRRPGEGTLRLRAGRWQSRARDPRTGKERSRTWPAGTTEAQARKQHATWVQAVAARQVGVRAETLDGTFTAYIDQLEQLRRAPATIRNAEHVARITLAELDRRTADIDPGHINALFRAWRRRYAPSTVSQYRAILAGAFDFAQQRGIIPTNPVRAVRASKPSPDRNTNAANPRVPTGDEIRRIITLEPDLERRCCWTLLAGTGVRPGELLALHWRHIDLEAGTVHVAQTVTADRATGRAILSATTKTHIERTVHAAPEAVAILAEWRRHQAAKTTTLVRQDRPVFAGETGHGGRSRTWLAGAWRAALERAEVPSTRVPHGIRHWHASSLVAANEAPNRVAAQLGHSTLTLLRTYAGHAPSGDRNVIASLPKLG